MRLSKTRGCLLVVLVLVLGGFVAYRVLTRTEPVDTRFNGAYRLDDGRLVFISPREGHDLRYRLMNGDSAALRPTGELTYEAGPGWSEREPVEVRVVFDEFAEGSRPEALDWRPTSGPSQRALRLALPETIFTFPSGELTLRGKLVLPEGEPPFPAVVLVHGSGKDSAVDTYFRSYLFASQGIATLAYDKRGTGESTGEFTSNFHVLADDTLAAVGWLRGRPEIDPERIHLAGYSQGGWIAPLAASKTTGIRSLLINYGPMVPVTGEDRWGYVYALEQKGFGQEAIDQADRIDAVIGAIFDHGEDRWDELAEMLRQAEGQPWFEAVKGSDSILGFLSSTRLPMWGLKLYLWWETRGDVPKIDRLYDPVRTVAELDVPSLWIFGGEDSSMPTGWSLAQLERLQQAGLPIETHVFAAAEHGILLFEKDAEGERRYLGNAPGYFDLEVEWLRRASDLAVDRAAPSN